MARNITWKIMFLLQVFAQILAPTSSQPSSTLDLFNPTKRRRLTEALDDHSVTNSSFLFIPPNPPKFDSNGRRQLASHPKSSPDKAESSNPVKMIGDVLLGIIMIPFAVMYAAWWAALIIGTVFGEFHELERWLKLDFSHATCGMPPNHRSPFHYWPKSPELVAQKLGKPLPSNVIELSKIYGKYVFYIARYHVEMLLSLILFTPFYLVAVVAWLLNILIGFV